MGSTVLLSHGGGGRLMQELIEEVFLKKFDNPILNDLGDSAVLGALPPDSEALFTTDSYVVKPLFFPGGDIGKLAVCGTVNDLSVSGARPAFISAGMIAEEGLEFSLLEKIASSMSAECESAGVKVVCGDFKVVESGAADGLYINTAGIGFRDPALALSRGRIKPGDSVIVNGPVGEHEAAVLLARGDFGIEGGITSDCRCLSPMLSGICDFHKKVLRESGEEVLRFMRDATRGGVAAVLNEMVSGRDFGISVFENGFPVGDDVAALCEILGLDPLYLANEGKVVAVVSPGFSDEVLRVMREHPSGEGAVIAGEVVNEPAGRAVVRTPGGGGRLLAAPEGGNLPRIC